MNLPSRYVAGIIDSFIRLEMKSLGGKSETLMPLGSRESSGNKRIPILCRVKLKTMLLSPPQPEIRRLVLGGLWERSPEMQKDTPNSVQLTCPIVLNSGYVDALSRLLTVRFQHKLDGP